MLEEMRDIAARAYARRLGYMMTEIAARAYASGAGVHEIKQDA